MRRIAILALASVAVMAAPASAAIDLGHGSRPDVAVAPGGTAHVVWWEKDVYGGEADWWATYCRLEPDREQCSVELKLYGPGPAGMSTSPRVFVHGSRVIVVAGGVDGTDRTLLWESRDSGESFGARSAVGTLRPEAAVLTRDGTRIVTLARDPGGSAVNLQSVPADGSAAATSHAHVPMDEAAGWVDIGLSGAAPVAVWGEAYTRHVGGDANAAAGWSSPTLHGGSGFAATLAGGAGGLFLADIHDTGIWVRPYDGQSWGGAVNATPADSGAVGSPDLAQDPHGGLHLVYRRRHDDADSAIRYVRSSDGRSFGDPVTLATSPRFEDLRLAVGSSGGLAVWRDYAQEPAAIRAVRLPVPVQGPPPPPPSPPQPPPAPAPAPVAPSPAATPRAPVLSRLRLTRRSFRTRARLPRLAFTLDRPATVRLTIHRVAARRGRPRTLRVPGRAGRNAVALGRRALRGSPGRYRLTAQPFADGLTGAPRTFIYRIRR